MYKYLVLGVILSLQLGELLGMTLLPRDNFEPYIVREPNRDLSEFRRVVQLPGQIPPGRSMYYAPEDTQTDNRRLSNIVNELNDLLSISARQNPTDFSRSLNNLANGPREEISAPSQDKPTELSSSVNTVGKQLSSEYLVTKGVGAHKLHLRKLPWNKARKVCIDEGGQLTDIRSDSEEKIVLRMLVEDSVDSAWIGYHDMFEEGDWVSVLGEPLGKSGWDRWWKKRLPNPDNNGGEEDCAALMSDGGGMNDDNCSKAMPFVCKITAL